MSVKRLAVLVLVAVGAIAATTSPAFALSATADTTWMTNGKVYSLAQSGNTLYVGGKFAQLVSPDGATKIKLKSLGRLDATTGNASPVGDRRSPRTAWPERCGRSRSRATGRCSTSVERSTPSTASP